MVSNILQLRADFQALLAFGLSLKGKNVLIQLDNNVSVAYIQKKGGTRIHTLMEEVCPILDWAQIYLTDLRAVYVPEAHNMLADYLSRELLSNNEWSLSHQAFSLLTEVWGIDLTSDLNKCQVSEIPVKSGLPISRGNRLSSPPLELQARIHISTNREIPFQAPEVFCYGDSSNSFLAEKALVRILITTQSAATTTSSGDTRPTISGSIPSSGSMEVALDGMEVERNRLLEQGCSQ